jgi:hypothetical protein
VSSLVLRAVLRDCAVTATGHRVVIEMRAESEAERRGLDTIGRQSPRIRRNQGPQRVESLANRGRHTCATSET